MASVTKASTQPYHEEESEQYGKALKWENIEDIWQFSESTLNFAKSLLELKRERAVRVSIEQTWVKRVSPGKWASNDPLKILEKETKMMSYRHLSHIRHSSSWRERKQSERLHTRRELEQLKSLCHPNVLQFYGYYSLDGFYTECSGTGTIHDYNKKGRKHKQYLLLWTRDLAAALCYLHNNEVFKRDVSPKNCFLFNGGRTLKLGPLHPSQSEIINIFLPIGENLEISVNKASISTFSYAVLLYLLIFTRSGDIFDYDKTPDLERVESEKVEDEDATDRILKKVVASCGRMDPLRRPAMSQVLAFILYHAPELTRFPVKDPVEL